MKQETFSAITIEELLHSDYKNIPDKPGIYRVFVPEGLTVSFSAEISNPAAPSYPVYKLTEKYAKCEEKSLVYIGKANGRGGLRQRIRQYMQYGCNKAVNHKGGRAIWQIKDYPRLLLTYEPCEDCEQREHQLLDAYKKRNNEVYPLANWRR